MNVRSSVVTSILALALVGAIIRSYRYSRKIDSLEEQSKALAGQLSEASTARQNAEEKAALLARQLQAQTSELAKLRAQISASNALRIRLKPEKETTHTVPLDHDANGTTASDIPNLPAAQPTMFPAASWQDLGGATAHDALQTFLWSLRTRNADRLVQFVDPADHELLANDGDGIASELAKVTGYSVLNSVEISPGQQMLRLRLDEHNGETKTEEFHFVNMRGQWHFSEKAKLAHLKNIENSGR